MSDPTVKQCIEWLLRSNRVNSRSDEIMAEDTIAKLERLKAIESKVQCLSLSSLSISLSSFASILSWPSDRGLIASSIACFMSVRLT